MTKDEKIKKIRCLDAVDLLNALKYFSENFNPIDDDITESFEITKDEVLYRLNQFKENRE